MKDAMDRKQALVWQSSIALASKVYSTTLGAPTPEFSVLQELMRRSALALASHIAEGDGKANRPERIRSLSAARSCLCELETQVYLAIELKILDRELGLAEEAANLRSQLGLLIRKLREQTSRDVPLTAGTRLPIAPPPSA